MIRRLLPMSLALLALPAVAQKAPPAPPAPKAWVALETSAGRIVIEVESAQAPITAANFLHYVDQKRLDGVAFYRTVRVAPRFGFVQFGVLGDPKRVLPPIAHEPTTQTGVHHLNGTISTARLAPGSARGDFTIMVGDQPSMDADPSKPGDNLGYAAFGHVVDGMEVIWKIQEAPVSPTATVNGAFPGQVPAMPVKILSARRVPEPPAPIVSANADGTRATATAP